MWCQTSKLESVLIPVTPWLEKNEGSKVVNQGQSVALECSARGVPLSVEWKIQRNIDETVKTISGCFSKFISRNILRSQQYVQREYWAILVLCWAGNAQTFHCKGIVKLAVRPLQRNHPMIIAILQLAKIVI